MYFVGSAQSHSVITTLRSIPWGLGGASLGYSPAAMRSVQSANCFSARSRPKPDNRVDICGPSCPDFTRRSHAAMEEENVPRLFGISRVALSPNWWQDSHPTLPVFKSLIHWAWLLTFGEMPLPCGPVPGNSFGA